MTFDPSDPSSCGSTHDSEPSAPASPLPRQAADRITIPGSGSQVSAPRELPEDFESTTPRGSWGALLTSIGGGEDRLTLETQDGQRVVMLSAGVLERLQDKADRYDQMTRHVVLTPQEREVLRRIASGCTASQAAQKLGLAIGTVSQHLAAVRRKFRVNSTADAIKEAAAIGHLD